MAIVVKFDTVLADRHMTPEDLAQAIGAQTIDTQAIGTQSIPTASLPPADGSAVEPLSEAALDETADLPFSTLEAICRRLDCQPGDILAYAEKRPNTPLRIASRFRWVSRF